MPMKLCSLQLYHAVLQWDGSNFTHEVLCKHLSVMKCQRRASSTIPGQCCYAWYRFFSVWLSMCRTDFFKKLCNTVQARTTTSAVWFYQKRSPKHSKLWCHNPKSIFDNTTRPRKAIVKNSLWSRERELSWTHNIFM